MGKKKADLNKLAIDGEIALLVMHCLSLGFLFWVNFVVKVVYGLPILQLPPAWSLNYYTKIEIFPWSLSELFWRLCLVASGLVVVTIWFRSRSFKCKWRLRFLSLLMSAFCFGFAALWSSFESSTVEANKYYIKYLKEEVRVDHPEEDYRNLRGDLKWQIEYAESQLKRWEDGKSGIPQIPQSSPLDTY